MPFDHLVQVRGLMGWDGGPPASGSALGTPPAVQGFASSMGGQQLCASDAIFTPALHLTPPGVARPRSSNPCNAALRLAVIAGKNFVIHMMNSMRLKKLAPQKRPMLPPKKRQIKMAQKVDFYASLSRHRWWMK